MNFNLKKLIFIILLGVTSLTLLGCNSSDDTEEQFYSVVYDGNGGYLGNKTYIYRKIQVSPDSVIPKYLSEYTQDPYVVSSLGLATRQGYQLMGWYLDDDAVYNLDPTGRYVYLDTEDGNGSYLLDADGDYVYGFVEDDEGDLIFVYVETLTDDYDPDTVEYIYYNGENGYGFYIYDQYDSVHQDIYDNSGAYTPEEVEVYGTTALVIDDLTEAEKTLFVDLARYNKDFIPYTEEDEVLDRYSFSSAFVSLETIFIADVEGQYVLDGTEYVLYDETNPVHTDLDRYSIDDKYKFVPDDTYTSPSDLEKYVAEFTYWDFENNRVNEDIVLYAHWERKLTVQFVQTLTGQTTNVTTKQSEDNTTQIILKSGETIGKIGTIPTYSGYTFVAWSKSETEFIPWDFENDVFPSGINTLKLYSYMIEGNYTRVNTASHLASVASNPDGKYVLTSNIDLEGAVFYNTSPTGIEVEDSVGAVPVPFTGEFKGMGYTISNYVISVSNSQKFINANAGIRVIVGFFPFVQDAEISGLNLEATIRLDTSSRGTDVVCDLGGAGLVGTALTGTTTVSDVTIDVTFTVPSPNTSGKPVFIGDVVAIGTDNLDLSNVTATIDYSAVTGITTDTLNVQTLD